ncbi:porin family protein [Spirosoma sordidisoli]|nr:porin family protein [Spirosoma sordidisoli]
MKPVTRLFFVLLLIQTVSFAQVRLGITGGGQLVNQAYTFDGQPMSGKGILGYHGGFMLDAIVTDNLSFRPQLLYSVKGAKLPDLGIGQLLGDLGGLTGLGSLDASVKSTMTYIEMPLQLVYSLDAGPGWINLGAGPYVAYGLSGKTVSSLAGQNETTPIDFGSGEDQAKRLDYGLRVSVGYELPSGLVLTGFYSPGLSNISNTADQKVKNTAFGLSLGFLFGGE